MNPEPEPCSTCGRRRCGKKSSNPGGSFWPSARATCCDLMNTTAGLTWSATATNALPMSAAGLAAGIWNDVPAAWAAGTKSAAPPRLGKSSVDANASPNTKARATRAPNFNQSLVRTAIASLLYFFLSISSCRRPRSRSRRRPRCPSARPRAPTARGRRNAGQLELPDRAVVQRHLALTLQHVDLHRGLVVLGGREDLRFLGRDRRVALYENGGHPAQGFNAERQRRHVEQQDVLHLARQHAPL